MCCRVTSFLGCVPLEGFGLFIGWFNLITLIIMTCFVALYTILAVFTAGREFCNKFIQYGAI